MDDATRTTLRAIMAQATAEFVGTDAPREQIKARLAQLLFEAGIDGAEVIDWPPPDLASGRYGGMERMS